MKDHPPDRSILWSCESCGLRGEYTIQSEVPGDVVFSIGVMTHALVSRSLAKSAKGLCRVQGAKLTGRDDGVTGFKLLIGATEEIQSDEFDMEVANARENGKSRKNGARP